MKSSGFSIEEKVFVEESSNWLLSELNQSAVALGVLHALACRWILEVTFLAVSAAHNAHHSWVIGAYHCELARIAVWGAALAFSCEVVGHKTRITPGTVDDGSSSVFRKVGNHKLTLTAVGRTQLTHSYVCDLLDVFTVGRVGGIVWVANLQRNQGSNVVACGTLGETCLGKFTSVPLAVGARVRSCKDEQR